MHDFIKTNSYILPTHLDRDLACRGLCGAKTPHNQLNEIEQAQQDMPCEVSTLHSIWNQNKHNNIITKEKEVAARN